MNELLKRNHKEDRRSRRKRNHSRGEDDPTSLKRKRRVLKANQYEHPSLALQARKALPRRTVRVHGAAGAGFPYFPGKDDFYLLYLLVESEDPTSFVVA
jgi:hypothetical protein